MSFQVSLWRTLPQPEASSRLLLHQHATSSFLWRDFFQAKRGRCEHDTPRVRENSTSLHLYQRIYASLRPCPANMQFTTRQSTKTFAFEKNERKNVTYHVAPPCVGGLRCSPWQDTQTDEPMCGVTVHLWSDGLQELPKVQQLMHGSGTPGSRATSDSFTARRGLSDEMVGRVQVYLSNFIDSVTVACTMLSHLRLVAAVST